MKDTRDRSVSVATQGHGSAVSLQTFISPHYKP